MGVKTIEHESQREPKTIQERMERFKEQEKKVDALPEKKPEDIAQLKIDAEELDRTLPEALALNVESNPEVLAYLKEKKLPQWHQVSHALETTA